MPQKNFYAGFNVLYDIIKPILNIHQKEEFYRLLFEEIYDFACMGLYDNDSIRKRTSGNADIHVGVMKKLHTYEGFEIFRKSIEENILPHLSDKASALTQLQELCNNTDNIPIEVKQLLSNSISESKDYQISRAIAAILVILNYSDYMSRKNISDFMDISFMRLSAGKPLPQYPRYITDAPDAAVEELIGREDELDFLSKELIDQKGKLLISAVGGLGKTELVKCFLNNLRSTETEKSGIEAIAWIPYDNHDIRLSIKQAMHLHCELEDVWSEIQETADDYRTRLLIVVDNIESADNDEYLIKLGSLQCRILVTSRQRKIYGFSNVLDLTPLKPEYCRKLFYKHYKFEERDNEIVNDIIELTAKLTIMIVFIAKAAYLETMSLCELYNKLVEKGFKLSEEDVSCEHEKMQNDETIIRQMCILFSLVNYSNDDKTILTYISVIPNLQFDFKKAKQWFKIKKNSSLMKLFNMGMLEHITRKRSHVYWMHSVIAAAIREQQEDVLYDTASPFVHELSEELEIGDTWGKGYTKLELIPFSWSVADLFENHWGNEDDSTFLIRLYYICFEASNYAICRKLIKKVIEIDKTLDNPEMLVRDFRNYGELFLRTDEVERAIECLDTARAYMKQIDPEEKLKREWAYLWHEYGNIYYHNGDPGNALDCYTKSLKIDFTIANLPPRELATDYLSIAMVYQMYGDLSAAYDMLQQAIEIDPKDDEDSESIMTYYYKATICSDLVANGYDEYINEAQSSYMKVIGFREIYTVKNSNDLADVYLEYANFLYQINANDKAMEYCGKAYDIYYLLYGKDSYHILQCLSTKALITAEIDGVDAALDIYEGIMEREKHIRNIPLSDLRKDYQNYASLLENAEKYEDSKAYFQKCIDLTNNHFAEDSPLLAESYIGMANCCMGLEDYDTALTYLFMLNEFADEDKLLAKLMNHKIAACYGFLNDYKTALEYLDNALKLCDENGVTDPGFIYVDLSISYYNTGQFDKAKAYGDKARVLAEQLDDPSLTDYVHNLDTFLP